MARICFVPFVLAAFGRRAARNVSYQGFASAMPPDNTRPEGFSRWLSPVTVAAAKEAAEEVAFRVGSA